LTGRFRDAEIASESIHSGVQLLSLYHDTLLLRAASLSKIPLPSLARIPSPHNRYTRYWTQKSTLYRRVAYVLQIVCYTELLCEMAAKRKGERIRWRVVMLLEAIKAVCRLLLMRITRSRPLVTPVLPEREPIPEEEPDEEDEEAKALSEMMTEDEKEANREAMQNGKAAIEAPPTPEPRELTLLPPPKPMNAPPTPPSSTTSSSPDRDWNMPRTGMSLPGLPAAGDITNYLLSRVLTADDIKPATKLLNTLSGSAHAAEVLHILSPLCYAIALARSENKRSWTPWAVGIMVELAARQLRDRSVGSGLRTTPLERDEWSRRGWSMGWWTMRGAFYENVMKGVVGGVKRRMPGLVAGILEDYEYLWENYHFSTSM
jgi:peroxin-16